MAKSISTHILIRAKPQTIWNILMDFASYSQWNPFITSISGQVAVGNHIRVILKQPGGSAMTMKPKVLVMENGKDFRWQGHLGIRGLFDGEHRFEIRDNGNDTCTFIQSEQFGGILVPLFAKMLDTKTSKGFMLMNEALKTRAEN
jgi:hypothetical protein